MFQDVHFTLAPAIGVTIFFKVNYYVTCKHRYDLHQDMRCEITRPHFHNRHIRGTETVCGRLVSGNKEHLHFGSLSISNQQSFQNDLDAGPDAYKIKKLRSRPIATIRSTIPALQHTYRRVQALHQPSRTTLHQP